MLIAYLIVNNIRIVEQIKLNKIEFLQLTLDFKFY